MFAPTKDIDEELKDDFYDQLENENQAHKDDIQLVICGLNAKIG